jgi:hypothetical protein
MAEDKGDPTAPAEPPSSAPGNPHFIGHHRPTQHNLRPALMQTAYPVRQMFSDFIDLALARAKSDRPKEAVKATLKANAERLKSAFESFADVDEARQHELVAILWAGFHVGRNYPGLANDLKKRTEAASKRSTEIDTEAQEFGLGLFYETRKEHPKWNAETIAKAIVDRVIDEMHARGHDRYKVTWRTVRDWYYEDRKKHRRP